MSDTLIAEFENAFQELVRQLREKPRYLESHTSSITQLLGVVAPTWKALIERYDEETERQVADVYRCLELFKKHPSAAQGVRDAVMKKTR